MLRQGPGRPNPMEATAQGAATRLALHGLTVSGIVGLFVWRFWPVARAHLVWRRPIVLTFLLANRPEQLAGGLLDQYHLRVSSLYYVLCNALVRHLGYETAGAVLYVLIAATVVAGAYALVCRLSGRWYVAAGVVVAFVLSEGVALPSIGANGTPARNVYNVWLFYGLVMLSLSLLVAGRWYWHTGLLLLGFLCHPPQGMLTFALLLPAVWWITRDRRYLLLHVSVGAAVIGAYSLHLALTSTVVTSALPEGWFHTVRLMNSGHMLLDGGRGRYADVAGFLAVCVAGGAHCLVRSEDRPLLGPLLVGGLVLVFGSMPFIYWIPVRTVYLLMPLRVTTIISMLVVLVVASRLLRTLERDRRWYVVAATAAALFGGVSACLLGMFLLAAAASLWAAWQVNDRRRWLCVAAIGVVAALLLVPAASEWKGLTRDLTRAVWAGGWIPVSVGCAAFWWAGRRRARGGTRQIAAAALVVLLVGAALMPPRASRLSQGGRRRTVRVRDYEAVGAWLRANTPPRRTILVAPLYRMPYLETVSGRGGMLQIRKLAMCYGAPHLWDPCYHALKRIGIDVLRYDCSDRMIADAEAAWRRMDGERLAALAREYEASCILTYGDHRAALPVWYRSRYFVVYGLPGRDRPDGEPQAKGRG